MNEIHMKPGQIESLDKARERGFLTRETALKNIREGMSIEYKNLKKRDWAITENSLSYPFQEHVDFMAYVLKWFNITLDEVKVLAKNIIETQASKVGRNDLCPCGSGKKFKRCCGK